MNFDLHFESWQWLLIVGLFIACVVVSERTMSGMKQQAVRDILRRHRDAGWCSRCLMREKRRLKNLSYPSVESERIRLKQTE